MKLPRALNRGPLAWMTQNNVAANLLMLVLLVGGLIMATRARQEVFPEFELDMVTVEVSCPGATPEEVEKSVVQAVEEAVDGLDGVDEVTSISREGNGTVTIKALEDADGNRLLQDVKAAVDRITTFPKSAESPQIALKTTRHEVLSLILTGSEDPLVLEWAEIARDDLARTPGITQVELDGVRDHEVLVEVRQDTLRRYGLTLADIARRIGSTALEQGGGTLRTRGGDIMLRLNERRDAARDFAGIAILTDGTGSRVLLDQIATVTDTFNDVTRWAEYNGQSAILLNVFRVGKETPRSVAGSAMETVDRLNATMPGELQLSVLRNGADVFQQRLDLLVGNALVGVVLVFVCLALFLQPSLAFWVSLGIPVSVLGSFLFLVPLGVSINMMSLFAFIVTLGIVVDDAIVVGENVSAYREQGAAPLAASVLGVREVGIPVIFSVLTNMVAFTPMFFVPGVMGKIWGVIPAVVLAVFACSLLESLFVLPAHLAHSGGESRFGPIRRLGALQQRFSRAFLLFVDTRYGPMLRLALAHRYLVIAAGITLLALTAGYVFSGRLGFDLMPRVESDYAYASATVPTGASRAQINEVKERLVNAGRKVLDANGGKALGSGIYAQVKDNEITVRIYLVPPDVRPMSTARVTALWREAVGNLPSVESLFFESDRGAPARARG